MAGRQCGNGLHYGGKIERSVEQSARDKCYERVEAAPLAPRGFFESVDEHFRKRKDVAVRFTNANITDMRWIASGFSLIRNFGFCRWLNIMKKTPKIRSLRGIRRLR